MLDCTDELDQSKECGTLAVQLVWVILPEVEMVCVKIFPSSGIQGPQMLSVA